MTDIKPIYNSVAPTVNDGGKTDFQVDVNGNLKVTSTGSASITSVVPGTGATNLGKAEDAVHTSGDTGVMALGVAGDGVTARAASGDYISLGTDLAGNQRTIGVPLQASATFTPAATAHGALDVVGGAQAFAFGALSGSTIRIISATMRVDHDTNETTVWALHLYTVTPPSALADDAVFDIPAGDRASYVGSISISQLVDHGSTLWIDMNNIQKQIVLAGTGLFGYLVNTSALTPNAAAHVVTIQAEQV